MLDWNWELWVSFSLKLEIKDRYFQVESCVKFIESLVLTVTFSNISAMSLHDHVYQMSYGLGIGV